MWKVGFIVIVSDQIYFILTFYWNKIKDSTGTIPFEKSKIACFASSIIKYIFAAALFRKLNSTKINLLYCFWISI